MSKQKYGSPILQELTSKYGTPQSEKVSSTTPSLDIFSFLKAKKELHEKSEKSKTVFGLEIC